MFNFIQKKKKVEKKENKKRQENEVREMMNSIWFKE
jgi:hypothetical protein